MPIHTRQQGRQLVPRCRPDRCPGRGRRHRACYRGYRWFHHCNWHCILRWIRWSHLPEDKFHVFICWEIFLGLADFSNMECLKIQIIFLNHTSWSLEGCEPSYFVVPQPEMIACGVVSNLITFMYGVKSSEAYWLYPIPGHWRLSRPACWEDIWQGGKVHGILQLQ